MAFDIVNGVAHFKIFYLDNGNSEKSLRDSIRKTLANYLSSWEEAEDGFSLIPAWTSTGRLEFHTASSYSGIGVVLLSIGRNGNSNMSCFKNSNGTYNYNFALSNTNLSPSTFQISGSSWSYLYLNIIKSKSGRSFAFSLSHNPSNQMECLIAEDESSDIALFQIGGHISWNAGYYFSRYLYLARDEKELGTIGSSSVPMGGSFFCLNPIISSGIKTSLVQTPNLLGNSLFKETYSILSTSIPLEELDDAIFVINGHKYKTVSCTSLERTGSYSKTEVRCAGPFALEIE